MYDLIRRIAVWLRLVLAPGTGTHRRIARPAAVPLSVVRRPGLLRLPCSPYHFGTSLNCAAFALVRPYYVAHERERARQARRRLALVLAADFGIDLDRHLIGVAQEVAA